ncbi:hypothetical protein PT286_04965 [Neisseriaceae bacterium ESL0693]|nr:hypothetical protein [Neisseriaceae bacterium ESL0693]
MGKLNTGINEMAKASKYCSSSVAMQKYFFTMGARIMGTISSVTMIAIAFFLFKSHQDFLMIDSAGRLDYSHFNLLAILMFVMAVVHLIALVFQSARSHVLSGFAFLLAAFVWFVSFGLLTIRAFSVVAMIIDLVLAIMCAVTGCILIIKNRNYISDNNIKKG